MPKMLFETWMVDKFVEFVFDVKLRSQPADLMEDQKMGIRRQLHTTSKLKFSVILQGTDHIIIETR